MATPAPLPSDVRPPSRDSQVALAVIALCLCGLLAVRTYSPRLFAARPTDEITPTRTASSLDLNRVERAELLQLPGVGPGMADAILSHRNSRGRFDAVDDLTAVPGVGDKTLDKLRPFLRVTDTVETLSRKPRVEPPVVPNRPGKVQPGDPKIDVNAASEAELMRLPRVGPVLAGAIVATRAEKKFTDVDDLRRVKGIGAKTLDTLRPFVTVGE